MKSIILLLFVCSTVSMFGQSSHPTALFEKGIIKGVVIDSVSKAPLAFATITLHRKHDNTFAGGCSSGVEGDFLLANVVEGDYFIKVSFVGYQNKFVHDVKLSAANSPVDKGIIALQKSALEIEGAEIVAEKYGEELHLDKKVINVSQNQNAAGGTALDVLQNQPSVRVDPDGTVYLRGSSNFTLLVNGKPSILQGSDALKQIAANTIESIEIMTNPSAKYDAEGAAGIINIVLKKQTETNLSGIANMNVGTRDKYNIDGSFSSNKNGVNITGGGEYRSNTYANEQIVDGNSLYSDGSASNSTDLTIRDHREQYIIRGSIDVPTGEHNSLSVSASTGKIAYTQHLDTKINIVNTTADIYSVHNTKAEMPIQFTNLSSNFTYQIVPKKDELTLEGSYNHVSLPRTLNTFEFGSDQSFTSRDSDPLHTVFTNNALRNEWRAKANYSHTFSEQSSVEMGVQSNFYYRSFTNENKVFNYTTGAYQVDPLLTNDFRFRNNVHAGYFTYTDAYKDFNFQVGLRAEYMDRLLEQQTLGGNYAYSKLDVFPSFSVSKKIDDHQIQVSFSRRVNRPNENLLNPFPFYSDSYLSATGNPRLLPEYINSYELNYQKTFGSVFASVQTFYRSSTDAMVQTFAVDKNGKLMTTYGNFASTKTYGAELSSSFAIVQAVRLDPGFSFYGTSLNGKLENADISRQTGSWTGRLNLTATLAKDTRLQMSGNYFGKSFDAQSEVKAFLFLNASLKQDLWDKTLSVILQANNFLKTSTIYVDSKGDNFKSKIKVMQEVPVINLVISYNFNNFKKSAHPTDNVDVRGGF